MDQDVMGGMLVPGHVVLKGALWTAAAIASVLPAALLGISTNPTAKLPLEDALVYGMRTALFAASFMYVAYFITSQQIDRESPQGRFLMHGSRDLAAAMFCTTVQVITCMAAALAAQAPARLPPYTPWCLGAYAATLVLAHAHQAFPATLWLWPLGRLQRQLAPTTKRALPPPVPKDNLLVVACRCYIAVFFWVMYGQLAPLYVTEKFALSHATVSAVAYTAAFVHGFIVSCLRWRSSLFSSGGKSGAAAAVTSEKKIS